MDRITMVLLIAIAIVVIALVVVLTRKWWTRAVAPPITTPAVPTTPAEGLSISQQSLFWGALASVAFAMVVDLLLGTLILDFINLNDNLLAHGIIVLALAAVVFVGGLDNVQTGFRAAVLIFGNRRLKTSGAGLSEGYQWTPPLISKLRQEDTRWKNLDISDPEGMYSKDGAQMSTTATQRYRINDIYAFLGTDGVVEALRAVLRQSERVLAKTIDAFGLRNADKTDFSDRVKGIALSTLLANGNPGASAWGLELGATIIEDIFATDPALSKAWEGVVRETAEGAAEQVEADRRRDQAKALIALNPDKVDPNQAIVAALVNAEKPGARIVSLPGLEGLGRAAERIAERLWG